MTLPSLRDFERRVTRLERTRSRVSLLVPHNELRTSDVETVYEALFLRGVTAFEQFLRELFLGILRQSVTYPTRRNVQLNVSFTSNAALRSVLFQSRNYLDWLPYDKTVTRANIYLRGGRPFTLLSSTQQTELEHVSVIRNAIAHASSHAKKRFKDSVLSGRPLQQREKTPAGFLRGIGRADPVLDRLQIYLRSLLVIARLLTR